MIKRITLLIILMFGLNINVFSQEEFTKATFKEDNVKRFIISKFQMFNGQKATGKGSVTVSFDINENGEVENLIPEINTSKSNGLNTMLAIQKTNGLWNPTLIDDKVVKHRYKIKVTFVLPNQSSYSNNILKAKKLYNKKNYEKALKIYNNLLKDYPDEPDLYLRRSEIKKYLTDEIGYKEDMEKYNHLKKEFLLHIRMGIFSKDRKRTLKYRKEVISTTRN